MSPTGTSSFAAEVVVLGGGIIGSAIAQLLASLDVDVLLVESAKSPGMGSSGRCDGNVLLQTKENDILLQLTQQSIEVYRRWHQELEIDIRFEQSGSLLLLTEPGQLAGASERLDYLHQHNISADLIDGAALRRLEPHLVEGLPGAIDCHDDAEVYPPAVVAALLVDAKRHGCRIMHGTACRELVVDRLGVVSGVLTSKGLISTRHVVNALGVWSPSLRVPTHTPTLPVIPRQGVLIVTDECHGLIRHNIREASYITDRSGNDLGVAKISFAAEPTYRGNLLLGSSRHFAGYDLSADPAIVSSMMARALTFVPELDRVHIIRTFAGLRPWTPDNKPLIGPCATLPGYVLATGHEGEGIGLAPATADLVATSLLGHAQTTLHRDALRVLSPDRFGELADSAVKTSESAAATT